MHLAGGIQPVPRIPKLTYFLPSAVVPKRKPKKPMLFPTPFF